MAARNPRPRILLLADVPDWIFARHSQTITELLSDKFSFTTKYSGQKYDEYDYDLIYVLAFNNRGLKVQNPSKYVAGIRSHRSWNDQDFLSVVDTLNNNFQQVHTISNLLTDIFEPFVPNISCVHNGIYTDFFQSSRPASVSGKGHLRIGWAGKKNDPVKRFDQFVAPLTRIKGVSLVFCGHDSKNLDMKGMQNFYNGLDAYICASDHEGSCNPILEAASMQRPIITTNVGTVPEFLVNTKSALIVEPELPLFIQAVIKLRDNPDLRVALGEQARKAVLKFDWKYAIRNYEKFFQTALKNRATWKPQPNVLSANLKPAFRAKGLAGQGYSKLITPGQTQALLLEKDAYIYGLQRENRLLKKQLESVTSSRAWRYLNYIKSRLP